MKRDLLGIRDLTTEEIVHLISRSNHYISLLDSEDPFPAVSVLAGRTVANLFFENSTRTRSSFELAERRLGASVLSLSMQTSSLTKGETLLDTVKVITAMRIDAIVVRHQSAGVPQLLRKHLPESIRIINAGDGAGEHPTQALLDAATLIEILGDLKGKHIVISGDISHSRVARSNMMTLTKLGATVTAVGPLTLLPKSIATVFGVRTATSLDEVLPNTDALISLRIQRERQDKAYFPNDQEFRSLYGMTAQRRARFPQLPILHPGPVNRGVELDDESMDSSSSMIFRQVRRGVAVRLAVLEWIFSKN